MGKCGDSPGFRWLVLIILCLGMFGYSYCCDNVVALQEQLQEEYNLNSVQYNMLYSFYSLPNVILPFIAGIVMDMVGMDIVVLAFFIFIVIGHGLFIAGCVLANFPVMIVGRFLFGAGCESYAMAISPLICTYFRGKELSFALGLTLSLSRIGSSVNDVTTYYVYEQTGSIIFAISVGFVLIVLCLVLILILLCYRMSHIRQQSPHSKEPAVNGQNGQFGTTSIPNGIRYELSMTANSRYPVVSRHSKTSISKSHHSNRAMYDSPLRFGHDFSSMRSSNCKLLEDIDISNQSNDAGGSTAAEETEGSDFKLSDIKQFDAVYWLLLLNCGLIYGCITPWMNVGADFLQETFGYSKPTCHKLLMVPFICGGIFTPTLGYLSDRIGKRTHLLFFSVVSLVGAHYIFGWSHTTYLAVVIVALGLLGIAFALFCAVIWPSFALVVEPRYLGTAYGIPTSFYNLMVTVDYAVVGVLTTKSDGEDKYLKVEYFLMLMSMVSVLSVVLLFVADMRSGKRLGKPSLQTESNEKKLSI